MSEHLPSDEVVLMGRGGKTRSKVVSTRRLQACSVDGRLRALAGQTDRDADCGNVRRLTETTFLQCFFMASAALLMAGCGRPCEPIEIEVVELHDCTNAHSNALSYSPGYCRAVMSNGERMDVSRPAMVGDKHRSWVCND